MTRPWLLVSGDFVPQGGMDVANFALATHLAVTGHDVHVVAHRTDPSLVARGVHVRRVVRPLGSHLAGMPLLTRAARALARELAPRGARVLANGGNLAWPGLNWVHYVHAAYDPLQGSTGITRVIAAAQRSTVLRQERTALNAARVVVCNSRQTMVDVGERLGIPPERLRVVYYGTDAQRFSPISAVSRAAARRELGWPADRTVALFVGALGDRRKGFDLLFESWRRLVAVGWDAHLVVAGGGRELSAWHRRAADAKLDQAISFLGYRHDIDTLIAASDVLVHPARYEAYGLSVHEAACRGIPVIVSARAGVTERLDPRLAPLTVQQLTADGVGRALTTWRQDEKGWSAIAADAAPRLAARSWSDMAAEIVALGEAL